MSSLPESLRDRSTSIRLLILDVDGVLTDGRLWYGPDGEMVKPFDAKDGLGLKMLISEGVDVAVLSARGAAPLRTRLAELGILHMRLSCGDKVIGLEELCAELKVPEEFVAYAGDDLLDLPVLRRVGLPITVADAHRLVQDEVAWHTRAAGGRGAVREICDALLEARGRLEAARDALLAPGME